VFSPAEYLNGKHNTNGRHQQAKEIPNNKRQIPNGAVESGRPNAEGQRPTQKMPWFGLFGQPLNSQFPPWSARLCQSSLKKNCTVYNTNCQPIIHNLAVGRKGTTAEPFVVIRYEFRTRHYEKLNSLNLKSVKLFQDETTFFNGSIIKIK